jgi:hypothetical protein
MEFVRPTFLRITLIFEVRCMTAAALIVET